MYYYCCGPAQSKELNLVESVELLEETIHALEIRLKSIQYQCDQMKLQAKLYHKQGDEIRCKAELRHRHERLKTYERYIILQSNFIKVRESIEDSSTLGEIAQNMGLANSLLKNLLTKIDPEKIDALMDDLSDSQFLLNDLGTALAAPIEQVDFDEEAAMEELWEELPHVPVRKERIAA